MLKPNFKEAKKRTKEDKENLLKVIEDILRWDYEKEK